MEADLDTDTGKVTPEQAVEPFVLALDAGTSSIRALAFDARGRSVTSWEIHRPYKPETTPGGGLELDADQLVGAAVDCLNAVCGAMRAAGKRPAAVACDTFWHSVMGVDARGRATTPVYTWADTRSTAAALQLRQRLDADAAHARTGAVLHPSYPPAKLLWLSQAEPQAFRRAAYWMSVGEYLYLHLFGERRVSISMASGTGLFDQNECTWDGEILAALPIRENQLSDIADFSEPMRGLRANVRSRLAGLAEIPWFLPLGDGACNNVGSGGCGEDRAVLMVGTSGAIRVVREAERVEIPQGLWTYRVDRRRFVQGGALSAGGNVFAWATKTLQLESIEEAESAVAGMEPDSHGLTILPFLAGERSPDWKPDAVSAFIGISLHTDPHAIVRALLESVTYRFALVFDILKQEIPSVQGIIGSGVGLVHSPAWMQIMTDALGHSMAVSAVAEGTSRGAALLALEAIRALDDVSDAPVLLGPTFSPRPAHTRIYRTAMERQQELYRRLLT